MSEQTIDKLQIEIEAKAGASVNSIDLLASSLDRLKNVTASGIGNLSRIATSINSLKSVTEGLKGKSAILTAISKSLSSLSNIKIDSSNLSGISKSFEGIGSSMSDMKDFSKGVSSMNTGLKNLAKIDLTTVSGNVTRLVSAIKPLTDEMIRGGKGVSNYGSQMKDLAAAMKTVNGTANSSKSSGARGIAFSGWQSVNLMGFISKAKVVAASVKRIAETIGSFITNINSYIESINLFSVAMGDSADASSKFAQNLQDVLGIDAGEAMKNMGLFNQLVTSFGVVSNQSVILSKNLTQLGYDISSFFNLSVDESFTKLQSGIAGEIEPLRRIGIDLSETRLQVELTKLGFEESFNSLTQADKSLLRYIAIMKQTTNAQGDMARTITTPANALRILSAQVTVAGRAIGSIFIPALTKILPPAIAVVKIIGNMASQFAAFIGFKMPTIDYSNVGKLSTGLETATDGADGLNNSLKKTKKEISGLLGFDEINALSSSKAADDEKSNTNILSGIELPSYDMISSVSNEVDKWVKKFENGIDGLKKKIKPFLPLIKTVGAAMLTAFGFNWIKKLLTGSKSISALSKIIKGVNGYLTSTRSVLQGGLINGFDALSTKMKGLSSTMKAGIGIAGFTAEALIAYNVFKQLTLGTMDASEAFLNLAPVTVVVGTALSAMLGPVGLVITAAGLAAGAVAGWVSADLELHREMEKMDFYAERYGVSITTLADGFKGWSDSVVNSNKEIIDNQALIEESQNKVISLTGEITNLKTQIEIGALSAKEGFPQINEKIKELHDESADTLKKVQMNITLALSGSIGQALADMGVSLPEIMSLVNKTVLDSNKALDESQSKLLNYTDQLSSLTVGSAKYNEVSILMTEELKRMGELSGSVADEDLNKLTKSLSDLASGIDFESPDAFKEAMSSIKTSVSSAKDSVNASYGAIIDDMQKMKASAGAAGNEAAVAQYDEYIKELENAQQTKIADIDKVMLSTGELIQNSFAQNVIETTKENKSSWRDKAYFWATEWSTYLASGCDNAFKESRYAEITAERISNDMSDELNSSFSETFPEAGANGIKGLFSGLVSEDELNKLKGAAKTLSDTIVGWFRKEQKIESPSKVMYELGEFSGQGVVNGLESEKTNAGKAAEGIGSKISSSFKTGLDTLKTNTSNSLSDLKTQFTNWSAKLKTPHLSWSHTQLSSDNWIYKTLNALGLPTSLPKLNVDWYASGGVFNQPRVIGVGEKGPEQVIPLAENAPWLDAVAERLVSRSNLIEKYSNSEHDNTDSGGDWTIILQKQDGTVEQEVTITAAERRNRRSGKTLIPV